MKGLLRSKRFKANLQKWLFMYVGVMALLTTVVTYSKYISNIMNNSEATRVTKFNIQIIGIDANGNECGENCYKVKYDAKDELKFYFKVDSSEVELDTNLSVTVNIDENFEIISLKKLINDKYESINFDSKNKTQINTKLTKDTIGVETYEVIVKFNPKNISADNKYDVMRVDYSAIQIAKDATKK